MAVEDRLRTLREKVDEIQRYARLVISNTFSPETLTELKGHAKDFCDEAKAELDLIKNDIDELGV